MKTTFLVAHCGQDCTKNKPHDKRRNGLKTNKIKKNKKMHSINIGIK